MIKREEALRLLGLHHVGDDIGESFNSIRIYHIIETRYKKRMSEMFESTSKVIAKKYVPRIREAFLELKRCFIEPMSLESNADNSPALRVVNRIPLIGDLTMDNSIESENKQTHPGMEPMIGTKTWKKIWFKGKITHVWSHKDKSIPLCTRKNWHVEYEDGDEEDLIWQELTMCQKDDLCNIELGDEGYEFWKSFEMEGTIIKIHQYQGGKYAKKLCSHLILISLHSHLLVTYL